jgi:large subunit ribosomal protein L25
MVIDAQPRSERGKNQARRLRHSGLVPGILYGAHKPTISVALNPKQVRTVLESEAGQNTILSVQLKDGETASAMIVDWQYEPLKGALLHVDLKRIALDQVLRVAVPVQAAGEAAGVKQQGGILEFVSRQVEVECLPADIPDHIDADVSHLMIGNNVRAKDLKLGERVKLAADPELVIVHVIAPKAVEEVKPEAAPVEAGAAAAEPEVIKKGKAEKEEGEGAPEGKEAKEKEKK